MNSPMNDIKIKMEQSIDSFKQDEYSNDIKSVQEVNNNSSTVLNNNPTTGNIISANSSISSLNNSTSSINNDQTTSTSSNQLVNNLTNNNNLSNSSSPLSTNQNYQNTSNANNSSINSHTSSNNKDQSNYTFEYWSQLMKDCKQLQTFSNLFMHVERLLDEEISRVRKALFQNNKFENAPLVLPEPEGPVIQKQEKVYVPIHEHPNYNFVGRILGPRGMTAKQLEQETGCKIMIRGKGSMRNKQMEISNRGKPNWEHLSDDLHVLIIVEDTENRAKLKIERAVEEVKKLLVPVTEGEDELKKKQLMELAIINGTYKDSNTRLLENEQLKLLPQTSPHHTALAAVSQQHLSNLTNHLPLTPQLHPALRQASLSNSHANNQSIVATSHHTNAHHNPATSIGTQLMMTRPTSNTHPLLLGNGSSISSPGTTQALLNQQHINENSQQALAAAAAAYLYQPHYDLSYAAQLTSGFIEYPMQSAIQAAQVAAQEASTGKQRTSLTGTTRDHPYQRPGGQSSLKK